MKYHPSHFPVTQGNIVKSKYTDFVSCFSSCLDISLSFTDSVICFDFSCGLPVMHFFSLPFMLIQCALVICTHFLWLYILLCLEQKKPSHLLIWAASQLMYTLYIYMVLKASLKSYTKVNQGIKECVKLYACMYIKYADTFELSGNRTGQLKSS